MIRSTQTSEAVDLLEVGVDIHTQGVRDGILLIFLIISIWLIIALAISLVLCIKRVENEICASHRSSHRTESQAPINFRVDPRTPRTDETHVLTEEDAAETLGNLFRGIRRRNNAQAEPEQAAAAHTNVVAVS